MMLVLSLSLILSFYASPPSSQCFKFHIYMWHVQILIFSPDLFWFPESNAQVTANYLPNLQKARKRALVSLVFPFTQAWTHIIAVSSQPCNEIQLQITDLQGSDQEIENGLRVVADNAGDHQGIPLLTMVFINLLASNDLSYYAKSIFILHGKEKCNQGMCLPSA